MSGLLLVAGIACLLQSSALQSEAFSFANYYGSSMVLHRAPRRAAVWGYADLEKVGQNVTATLSGAGAKENVMTTVVVPGPEGLDAVWKVLLPATPEGGPYTLTATLGSDTITLSDLLFGDVWLCSGQSNMEMQTYKTINGTEEMEKANLYPNIRIFKVGRARSEQPLFDVTQVDEAWTRPYGIGVGQFSSLCWSYGRKLHEYTKVPIGLVSSSWGGTPVEAWSSVQALQECYGGDEATPLGPSDPSVLYNAMIHPLLNMTITGAIWYQGEWNARRIPTTASYECTFPSLIRNWRRSFLAATEQTDELFPFGFVQLAGQKKDFNLIDGFPHLRWKQTALKGGVPNSQMPNTFMAVAMDLQDFNSPHGPNHPRDKTTISDRLLLGARAIVLGEKSVGHSGPLPAAYRYKPTELTIELQYDKTEELERERTSAGFDICCSTSPQGLCDPDDERWMSTDIINAKTNLVTLTTAYCRSMSVLGHRYAWRTNPCPYKECALYSTKTRLPAPVYVSLGQLKGDGQWHDISY